MEKQKLNILPAPTYRWLGVNYTECGITTLRCDEHFINAASGEEKSDIIYLDREGITDIRITAADAAKVKLVQIFDVKGQAVSKVSAEIGENASFELVQLYLGGNTVSETVTELSGRGAGFSAEIGYLLNNDDRLDLNLVTNHHGRKTISDINAKGVLDGNSRKTFKGTIDFRNGSSGAKGSEKEDVLILSEEAVNKTVPLILCAEEDVEGNHGASIGRIDEKQIFYMQSRGIPEEKITELIAQSRIDSVIGKIGSEETEKRILKRLGRGETDE